MAIRNDGSHNDKEVGHLGLIIIWDFHTSFMFKTELKTGWIQPLVFGNVYIFLPVAIESAKNGLRLTTDQTAKLPLLHAVAHYSPDKYYKPYKEDPQILNKVGASCLKYTFLLLMNVWVSVSFMSLQVCKFTKSLCNHHHICHIWIDTDDYKANMLIP